MKSSDSVADYSPVQHGGKRSNTFTHFFDPPTGAISPLRTKSGYNEPCLSEGGGSLTVMMLLLAKRPMHHTRGIRVILFLWGASCTHAGLQTSSVTDTDTGDAAVGSCRILNLLLQDRERERKRERACE